MHVVTNEGSAFISMHRFGWDNLSGSTFRRCAMASRWEHQVAFPARWRWGSPPSRRLEQSYAGEYDWRNNTAINPDGTQKWGYTDWRSRDQIAKIFRPRSHRTAQSTLDPTARDFTQSRPVRDGEVEVFANIYINSVPAVGADGVIYVVSADVYAINPDGTLKWDFNVQGTELGPLGSVRTARFTLPLKARCMPSAQPPARFPSARLPSIRVPSSADSPLLGRSHWQHQRP